MTPQKLADKEIDQIVVSQVDDDSAWSATVHSDYSKSSPNRFAGRMADRVVVLLDPDISEVFTTPEAVNTALRALISSMPKETQKNGANCGSLGE